MSRNTKRINWPTTPCKGCGKPIIFARLEGDGGKVVTIPLDAAAIIYDVDYSQGRVVARRRDNSFLSHFVTCPAREQFSGKNRKQDAMDGVHAST